MIKVLIVDDHALFRAGIHRILEDQDLIEVVGEAESGEDALRLAPKLAPDVILMDLNMPGGMGGIEATRRLGRVAPRQPGDRPDGAGGRPLPGLSCGRSGALGYLTKGCPAEELVRAIRAVAARPALYRRPGGPGAHDVRLAGRPRAALLRSCPPGSCRSP